MCQDRAEADSPMLFLDPVPSPLLILILRVMFSSGPVVVVVVVVVVAVVVVVMMGMMMMMGEAPWLAGRVPGFLLLLLGLRGCCFPWGLSFGEIS